MTDWNEMTKIEQYRVMYWDMYKDAYGVRPRGVDVSSWTEQDFELQFEKLSSVIEDDIAQERLAHERAAVAFEQSIESFISSGAKDRESAIRWIAESESCLFNNGSVDHEMLCFKMNLPFNYFEVTKDAA